LPVRVVVQPKEVESSKLKVEKEKNREARSGPEGSSEPFTEYGTSVNSGPFSGMESETAIA
jgi:hypothetical protein